jgi:hypothetical protein
MKISDLLNEEEFPKLKIGDIDPRNGKKILSAMTSSDGTVVRSRFGDIWNVKYGEPDKAPEKTPDKAPERGPDVPNPFMPAPTPDNPNPPADAPAPTPEEPLPPDVVPDPDPTPPEPTPKCSPEVLAKIKAAKTFSQAYALAKQSECPEFGWCQIVDVPGQAPSPQPAPTPGVSNPMGDFDPTDFSGDFTGGTKREAIGSEEEELEESEFRVPESAELHRMREIAGTQVVHEAGGKGIPEIKAPSKQAAIEIARKKGIKRFRFCGQYKVKAGKKGQAPSPRPTPKPPVVPPKTPVQGVTTNPMGDFDPTAFSGDFTGGTKR